jgi:hypothetical protein
MNKQQHNKFRSEQLVSVSYAERNLLCGWLLLNPACLTDIIYVRLRFSIAHGRGLMSSAYRAAWSSSRSAYPALSNSRSAHSTRVYSIEIQWISHKSNWVGLSSWLISYLFLLSVTNLKNAGSSLYLLRKQHVIKRMITMSISYVISS